MMVSQRVQLWYVMMVCFTSHAQFRLVRWLRSDITQHVWFAVRSSIIRSCKGFSVWKSLSWTWKLCSSSSYICALKLEILPPCNIQSLAANNVPLLHCETLLMRCQHSLIIFIPFIHSSPSRFLFWIQPLRAKEHSFMWLTPGFMNFQGTFSGFSSSLLQCSITGKTNT